ncbi:MAG TPA: hypothetical protein VI078_03505 [bacterium]
MRRLVLAAALAFALCGLAVLRAARAADAAPEPQSFTCAECGMTGQGAGRFTARLVAAGVASYFCDIGDLVAFIKRTHPAGFAAAVRDFPSGEWIDAGAARFVVDKKAYATPMGWGVAAFRDAAAAPGPTLDFGQLQQALP